MAYSNNAERKRFKAQMARVITPADLSPAERKQFEAVKEIMAHRRAKRKAARK